MTNATTQQPPEQVLIEPICDRERVAIIFNPVSGTEDGANRRSDLEALARSAGITCPFVETDKDRGAGPLAEQAVADGMERVIVSGGDGSVTESAHALTGTATSLAVVPGGTGNILALNLGIPTNREAAMRLALTGEARPTDVGRANGTAFLVAAGMGLDARVMRDADRELKNRYGKLAYFIAVARNLGQRHARYRITIDGVRRQRYGQMVMIANLGRITGGLELVPGSDPDDGKLEVAILRTRRLRDFGLIALRALLGRTRGDDLLEILQGRDIVVETHPSQPVQIDGDEIGRVERLEVHVEQGALLLVRPARDKEATPMVDFAVAAGRRSWLPVAVGATGVGLGLWIFRQWRVAHR